MHVCIDYRPALREGTGVGTYVRGLLGGLVRRHPETTYTAFSASWRDRLELPTDLTGVTPADARIPVRLLDKLWHSYQRPGVERWAGAIDVAHSPSPLALPSSHAAEIVTIHDCYFLREPDRMSGVVRRDYVPLAQAAAARAEAILTVSETTRNEVIELLGVAPERVHVTYNGGGDNYCPVAGAREKVRAKFGIERPFVLFAGRREYRKDLPTLLAAFDRLLQRYNDLELVLVGPAGDAWDSTWATAPSAVQARTTTMEHQTQQDLELLYGAAQALVLPSLWEGFGLTGIEAMACGTPVVAAEAGAMPEVYGDAAEWFPAGEHDALAHALDRVLSDEDRRKELIGAGHARADLYTWDACAEVTHAVYKDVLR